MIRTNVIDLKATSISLRKEGLSFSEIQKQIPVSKSTLSGWFQDLKLTSEQLSKLKQKRAEVTKRVAEKKIAQTRGLIEAVRLNSSKDIGKISKRELWLMGLILYWRERVLNKNESDLHKGVRFSSSDPYLINLFLKWLHDVGGLKKDELNFDIFVTLSKKNDNVGKEKKNSTEVQKIVDFWAVNTGFHNSYFNHIYYQKNRLRRSKRKITNRSRMGLLRIRVKASSMLARQISGWIEGVKKQLLTE